MDKLSVMEMMQSMNEWVHSEPEQVDIKSLDDFELLQRLYQTALGGDGFVNPRKDQFREAYWAVYDRLLQKG